MTSNWQTVTVPNSYNSMVVVATPRYDVGSGPGVARIRNVTSNSFEVRVDNVGTSAFSGDVYYGALRVAGTFFYRDGQVDGALRCVASLPGD